MNPLPKFRVVFLLAFCFSQLGAAGFGPLATSVPMPEPLRNRPIWHVSRLADGELALGFEGGLALGFPGGRWRVIAAPGGQTVKVVSAGHGKILVAGLGFCGFFTGESVAPLTGLTGEYICAETVTEGWLVAGSDGVWWISPSGAVEFVARPEAEFTGNQSRVCRVGATVVVSLRGHAPRSWRNGRLVDDPVLAGFGEAQVLWSDGDLCVTTKGIFDQLGKVVPADAGKHRLIGEGGIVGLADTGTLAVVGSFNGGLSALDRTTGREVWAWRAAGDIYCVARNGDGILLGTATGVYSIANPSKVRYWGLNNVLVFELLAEGTSAAKVITASGRYLVSDDGAEALAEAWPRQGDVEVRGFDLRLGQVTTKLRSRFVTGLADLPDAVAASLGHELVVLSRTGQSSIVPLAGVVGAVATDGRNFLAATTSRGVHVVSPDGRMLDRIGHGRANVSELGPSRVALLFWDGTILDSGANRVGRIRAGNPRDAIWMHGQLAVLVTRLDREPVIGYLQGESWQPLEIPGLAEIEAEQIAVSDTHLFAAGPRGVLRIRLPVVPSVPPPAAWRWSEPAVGNEITLGGSARDTVRVSMAPGEIPPAPTTQLRLRVGEGGWTDVPPGESYPVAVAAGRTRVVTQAERNHLVTEAAFTVIRPWPWWQRAWVWPLYAALLGGLIFGIARLRTRQLVRRNRELEVRVSERTLELRKANVVKEEFLASISHEIRNPLNGVVGICAMLADRNVGPREQMLVRALGGCADQLRSMLDDILDFSQLDRKTPTLANNDF